MLAISSGSEYYVVAKSIMERNNNMKNYKQNICLTFFVGINQGNEQAKRTLAMVMNIPQCSVTISIS